MHDAAANKQSLQLFLASIEGWSATIASNNPLILFLTEKTQCDCLLYAFAFY
jgi:hypothetical protein